MAAEADDRHHAFVERVIADVKNGPLAHLPSGNFMANSRWLVLAAMAFDLSRAIGLAAGGKHPKALPATVRAHLITAAARITRRATLRLPTNWPSATGFAQLAAAGIGPPTTG